MQRITERQRRFLDQYALDFNAAAAATRAGYCGPNLNRVGCKQLARFAVHPETRALIRQEAAALGLGRRAIITGLLNEALGLGLDTRSKARVRAWGALLPFCSDGSQDDGRHAEEEAGAAGGPTIRFRGADGRLVDEAASHGAGVAGRRDALTPREQRFVEHYQADFCASRAARRAGYSASYADKPHELLGRLRDRPELAVAEKARRAALSAAIRRTLSGLLAEARGDGRPTRSSARVSAWIRLARFLGMAPGPIKPRPPEPREIVFLDWKGNIMEPGGRRVDGEGDRVDVVSH